LIRRERGKQVGADAIVSGTITVFGSSVKINARLIEVEKGDVLAAAGAEVTKNDVVVKLMNQILTVPTGEKKEPAKVEESPSPPVGKLTSAQGTMKVQVKNFEFALQECKKAGTQVTCSLLVTNLVDDRDLSLDAHPYSGGITRLFDTNGNVFNASSARLGKQEGVQPSLRLILKIPTRAAVSFEKVASDTNGIALLDVGFVANGGARAQFRDVPLSQ